MHQEEMGFGIIGCGLISEFHARAIQALPKARLVGFADVAGERARQRAAQFGGIACTDYHELLVREDVDVVNVCTPNGLHEQIVLDAAAAGKHVLVEKPLEITLERADRMIAACHRHRVTLATVHQARFRPAVVAVKEAVDAGKFGRLLCGDAVVKWHRSKSYYHRDPWRSTRALQGGGVMMQIAIHYLDLLRWILGPVRRVTGRTFQLARQDIEVEDSGVAVLEFACGAVGVVEASTAITPGLEPRLEIHGERGTVLVEGDRIREWNLGNEQERARMIGFGRSGAPTGSGGEADFTWEDHRAAVADLIDAIRRNRRPAVSGEEGRRALELVLAIYRSAELGTPVELQHTPDAPASDSRD